MIWKIQNLLDFLSWTLFTWNYWRFFIHLAWICSSGWMLCPECEIDFQLLALQQRLRQICKKTILSITLIGNRFILIPILISYVVFTFTHWRTPSHGSTGSGRRNLYFFETDKLFKNVKNCDIYTFKLINGSNVQNCNYSQGW